MTDWAEKNRSHFEYAPALSRPKLPFIPILPVSLVVQGCKAISLCPSSAIPFLPLSLLSFSLSSSDHTSANPKQ